MNVRTCSHRRATFYAIQPWKHRPDVILFNCPDCKGTFALETLIRMWREEEVAATAPSSRETALTAAS